MNELSGSRQGFGFRPPSPDRAEEPGRAGKGAGGENGEALILCRDVSLGYEGRPVIRDLSFTVNSGDYLCVAGENGSGKTTLIKGLIGLLSPLRGSLVFTERIKGNGAGYLPQQAAAKKDFPAGVYEIVLSGTAGSMGFRPFYSREAKETALENMRRLDIGDLRNRCFRELSGGQQRRVLIARALCASRRLLVLDEPAAGLDPLVTADLYGLLDRLNRETEITVIMVSHDIQGAVKYANQVLHIKNHRCFFGKTAEYLESELGKEFINRGGAKDGRVKDERDKYMEETDD
jgi:zinc transport system ATP-binding protein